MPVEYSVSALLNQLRGVDLLRELDDDILSVLAERVTVTDYEPDDVVVAEGDEASGLFLILRGTAMVERGHVPLAVVGVGEHIGEVALLDGQPRVATVRAQADLRTGFLTSADFLDVLEGSPSVALELLLAMTARFRMLEERLSEAEARLADAGD
ncbi:MAG: cyclic nucleotide-binding domain-containing protein [Jiangellales bacterium]